MKKVIFIAVVAVASLASCKKDRTCTCTSGGYSSVTTYTKAKKSDARVACLSYTATSSSTSYVVTCELK